MQEANKYLTVYENGDLVAADTLKGCSEFYDLDYKTLAFGLEPWFEEDNASITYDVNGKEVKFVWDGKYIEYLQ